MLDFPGGLPSGNPGAYNLDDQLDWENSAMMNRRQFLEVGSVAALSVTALAGSDRIGRRGFQRNYAPNPVMFRHHAGPEPIDQIRFLADEGFRSIEDTGLRAKPAAVQARIGAELARRGMCLACFTGVADFGRPTYASGRRDVRLEILRELRGALDAADRAGGKALSVVPGQRDARLDKAEQRCGAVDLLSECADLCERRGVVLLLESIDHGQGHSRLFLRSARQAAELCRAVGRPSCRILVDVYQQAVAGEDVPQLLEAVGDVLGHVQLGDFPGRNEPGTGELDFRKLLATLDAIGYRSAFGMEHGTAIAGRAGERAVIDAYHALGRLSQRPIA
jgi:hydroxypyruvate isomerase